MYKIIYLLCPVALLLINLNYGTAPNVARAFVQNGRLP